MNYGEKRRRRMEREWFGVKKKGAWSKEHLKWREERRAQIETYLQNKEHLCRVDFFKKP